MVDKKIKIAIDGEGGDSSPDVVLKGIKHFIKNFGDKGVDFLVFVSAKNELSSKVALQEYSRLVTIQVADSIVNAEDKPSHALKNLQDSTMGMAIKAVKNHQAHACISAGNTGAYMALSRFLLGQIDGIDKPALCTMIPTIGKKSVMLDMGAVVECKPQNLLEFAMMGKFFISSVYPEISDPTIGLINVGREAGKGNDLIKQTYELIKNSDLSSSFYGFIEGDDIPLGTVNVVLTDGFTGNVALKVFESVAKTMYKLIKKGFMSSIWTKIGYLFAQRGLKHTSEIINPNNYNGALMLGIDGVAIKSHGSANPDGFANAIKVAYNLASQNIIGKISEQFKQSEKND